MLQIISGEDAACQKDGVEYWMARDIQKLLEYEMQARQKLTTTETERFSKAAKGWRQFAPTPSIDTASEFLGNLYFERMKR